MESCQPIKTLKYEKKKKKKKKKKSNMKTNEVLQITSCIESSTLCSELSVYLYNRSSITKENNLSCVRQRASTSGSDFQAFLTTILGFMF
jgi:hypothetical protein